MTQNDTKWHEMTQNDTKWHEMTWNDSQVDYTIGTIVDWKLAPSSSRLMSFPLIIMILIAMITTPIIGKMIWLRNTINQAGYFASWSGGRLKENKDMIKVSQRTKRGFFLKKYFFFGFIFVWIPQTPGRVNLKWLVFLQFKSMCTHCDLSSLWNYLKSHLNF